MLFKQLKRIVIYYIIAGVVFSSVFYTVMALTKYEHSISDKISKHIQIRKKITDIKRTRVDIESEIKYIRGIFMSELAQKSPGEFIFNALDDIRMKMPRAELIIADIKEETSETSLHVEIKIPVYNYTTLVNNIGYLESLKLPLYSIENISIAKSKPPKEDVTCNIKGTLRMPVLSKALFKGTAKQ